MDVPKTQFDIDHVEHSVGGLGGHAFRRITHVSMALIPVIYYSRGEEKWNSNSKFSLLLI